MKKVFIDFVKLKNNINSALTLNGKITVNKEGLFTDNQLSLGSVNLEASETKTFVLPIDISKNAVLGSYSANFTFVNINDATDNTLINKNIKVEDEVIVIGKAGKKEISVEELAKLDGTINYEIVARLNPLIERKII